MQPQAPAHSQPPIAALPAEAPAGLVRKIIANFPIIAMVGIFPLVFFGVMIWVITTSSRLVPNHPFYGPDQTKIDNAPLHVFKQRSHYSQYAQIQADSAKRQQLEAEIKSSMPEFIQKQLYYVTAFTTSHGEAAHLFMPLLVRVQDIDPEKRSLFMLIDLQNYGKLHFQSIDPDRTIHMKCVYPMAEDFALPADTSMTIQLTPVF